MHLLIPRVVKFAFSFQLAMSQRQGVIFDVEDQAAEALGPLQHSHQKLANSSPFAPEEETPLQQPRPPERPRKR